MNIFRLVISFITISYIAIFNVAIASISEQEPSDVKVQSEQNGGNITSPKEIQSTIIKSNEVSENQIDNLLNPNNEIKAIVKIEDKKESIWKNPAFCAVIGALFAGLGNLVFEIIRQRHTEKMQKERNEQELLLLKEKNKQEQQLLFLEKKLNTYIDARDKLINWKPENILEYGPIK